MSIESVKFDRAVDYYDKTRGFPPGVEENAAALVARVGGLGKASRSLEIGVGTGRIALPMAKHVGAVVGIDLSRPMMERLRAKQNGEPVFLVEANASQLPFGVGSFDAVVAVHVFHLIPTWRDALAEIARVLRPGAPLVYARNVDTMHGLWDEMRQRGELTEYANVGVQDAERDTFLADAGWQPQGEAQETTWEEPFRPSNLLSRITNRLTSSTWRMTDAEIEEYAAALRRALSEHFPDLDSEYVQPHSFSVRPFLPPGV